MANIPEDLRALYEEFGRAAESAQLMETEAGNLALTFVAMVADTSNITSTQRDFYRALVDDVNKRTFGDLMRQIRKVSKISEGLDQIIDDGLEKRNYLIHKFFRTHNFAIHSDEGRKAMRAELREIHATLNLACTVLSGMTATLAQASGKIEFPEEVALELAAKGKRVEI